MVGGPAIQGGELLQEDVREMDDVVPPLPERRHVQADDVQAMEEVFAEAPVGHPGRRSTFVAAMMRTSTRRAVDTAHRGELLFLHEPQELALHLERQLADLVQQDGAAVRPARAARLAGLGAREGALLVSEELALDQRRREGGAVDHDQWLVAAATEPVQRLGERSPCPFRSRP